MAATKRLSTHDVDYVQLSNFSSIVLYNNTAARLERGKGKTFQVERIIRRKKEKHASIKVKLAEFTM
jgi:hypothetical protein